MANPDYFVVARNAEDARYQKPLNLNQAMRELEHSQRNWPTIEWRIYRITITAEEYELERHQHGQALPSDEEDEIERARR